MMSKKKETAEQKLLKMIEASSGADKTVKAQKKAETKVTFLSVLRTVKIVLIVLIIFAFLYCGFVYFSEKSKLSKAIKPPVGIGAANKTTSAYEVPEPEDLDFYLAGVDSRNIFQPFEAPEGTPATQLVAESSSTIQKLTMRYKLVGIAWLDEVDTASVMIEDMDKGETYFVKSGENIEKTDIKIKKIYADSAVLGYENEEMIIKYDKSQM